MPSVRIAALTSMLFALAAQPATGAENYVAYDYFGSPPLASGNWLNLERTRAFQQKGLRLIQRDLGDQYSDSGTRRSSYGVDMVDPNTVTEMRAKLKVSAIESVGCQSNAEVGETQARLIGAFFAVQAGAPGDQLHDVIALARLTRYSNSVDPAGVMRVEGLALSCASSDCRQYGFLETVDLGTAALDEAVNLRMVWDADGDRFRFSRDGAPFVNISYGVSDGTPPNLAFKSLQTRTILPNCFSGPRASGYVDVRMDDFMVNASAVP